VLSYRHAYHAGNIADLLKHIVLLALLDHMRSKDKGFKYIDTHSGAGAYSLRSEFSEKTAEWQRGIGRHLGSNPKHPLLDQLLSAVQTTHTGVVYPGSPRLAASALRRQDSGACYELHSTDAQLLANNLRSQAAIKLYQSDGLAGLLSQLPTPTRRALVLIDPSYELKTDYQDIPKTVHKALSKMDNAVIAIWYPVVDRSLSNQMVKALTVGLSQRVDCFELGERADSEGYGMTSSGMLVINSPWDLAQSMSTLLPELAAQHSLDGEPHYRCDTLVAR
jgi:23S rRNA (adenine2030-N6)-methyltransferase